MKVAEFGFNLRADGERQVTVGRWGYRLLVFDRSLHIAHARRLCYSEHDAAPVLMHAPEPLADGWGPAATSILTVHSL